jgi:hypothetical protein
LAVVGRAVAVVASGIMGPLVRPIQVGSKCGRRVEMEQTAGRYREATSSHLLGIGAIGGLVGGFGMAMWQMIYSASTGDGFWTPLNVCMASFVYRADVPMMIHDSMMHPGMSMNEPVQASHLLVGTTLHFAFSAVVGMAFALVLLVIKQSGLLGLLGNYVGYVAASIAGGAVLYFLMWYLVLPWANSEFKDLALRGPFFVAHLVFGLLFGLVAFPLLRRSPQPTQG